MPDAMTPAQRTYVGRFAGIMSLYVVLVFAAPVLADHVQATTLKVGLALAPALAILGVIWAVMRYLVEETDEYLRARLSQALLVGLGLTLALCTVWGFLQAYDFAPTLPLVDVPLVFCGLWGLSQLAHRLWERVGGRG